MLIEGGHSSKNCLEGNFIVISISFYVITITEKNATFGNVGGSG